MGEDPSGQRRAARNAMTVAEVCAWYLDEAKAGKLLGRSRKPIKQSTLKMDASRIETHVIPLLGSRTARSLALRDIEAFQTRIAAGVQQPARRGRGGQARGGDGVAARTTGMLRTIFSHAHRAGLLDRNPATGARLIASSSVKRRLSEIEVCRLGEALSRAEAEGEHPVAIRAIRFILLTGFRRMEALGLQADWIISKPISVAFPDTKSGAQIRPIGRAAFELLRLRAPSATTNYVFPSDKPGEHFRGLEKVLARICREAGLENVTAHTLRHTFASIAAELNFSELTIRGLLGHAAQGVTQRYVHLDAALILAANKTADRVEKLLGRQQSRAVKSPDRPSGVRAPASLALS